MAEDQKSERSVRGMLPNGELIYLGHADITEYECEQFLTEIARIYREGDSGSFSVGQAVYDAMKFIGVLVGEKRLTPTR